MKVLLVQPPVRDFYDTDVRLQPIGLAYLKSAVRNFLPGIEIRIKDFHGSDKRTTVPIPKELGYLRDYYSVSDKSPFSTFHQYYHFGDSFDEIERVIADLKPDVVGISSLFTQRSSALGVRISNRQGDSFAAIMHADDDKLACFLPSSD